MAAKPRRMYFDEVAAVALMVKSMETGVYETELMRMHEVLMTHLLRAESFRRYPQELKEDMAAQGAFYFLRYGHNFNPAKSNSKAPLHTFLTTLSVSAFKRVLKREYKHINLQRLYAELISTYPDLIVNTDLLDSIDSTAENDGV